MATLTITTTSEQDTRIIDAFRDFSGDETAGATAWDATAEADNTNEALAIKVTGEAATNIRWVAKVDIAQVTYA